MNADELVEKVGRTMAREAYSSGGMEGITDPYTPDADYWNRQARAAIAVLRPALRAEVLEEAAKVVAAMPRTYDKIKEDHDILGMKGTWTFTLNNGPAECAAAIRAMIPKD